MFTPFSTFLNYHQRVKTLRYLGGVFADSGVAIVDGKTAVGKHKLIARAPQTGRSPHCRHRLS